VWAWAWSVRFSSLEVVASVPGAAGRVGAGIAHGLGDGGCPVVAHVHHDSDEASAGTNRVVAELADPAVAEVVLTAVEALPSIGLLVNNAVRFAWDELARPNLMNQAGLPANSFRTDAWPLAE